MGLDRAVSGVLAGAYTMLISFAANAASDIALPDARVFPESVTSSADGTVFVGSIGKGVVYRAAPGAAAASLFITKEQGAFEGVFGVLADDAANTLWVCSGGFPPPGGLAPPATLKSFDLKTGAAKATYPIAADGFCNDIAVAKDGTVYVADTNGGSVLRLKKGASVLEVWAKDPKLATADGIAVLEDGAVYVNGVQTNVLVRMPVGTDGKAGAVVQLKTSRPLQTPDGMRAIGGMTMLLTDQGILSKVTIKGDAAQVDNIKTGLDTPSAVTLVGDTAYVTEAKLNYLFDPALSGKDPGAFRIVAVPYPAK